MSLRVCKQLQWLLECQTVISFLGGQRRHLFSAQKEADLGENAPPLVRNKRPFDLMTSLIKNTVFCF